MEIRTAQAATNRNHTATATRDDAERESKNTANNELRQDIAKTLVCELIPSKAMQSRQLKNKEEQLKQNVNTVTGICAKKYTN